uniref:RNA-directed DNA polymerase n=1 Tax=Pyricularia oryzae (strain P131) TaxID=1143193 RepID=L7J7U2_PYRO1
MATTANEHEHIHLELILDGKPIRALLDSGAQGNYIAPKLVNERRIPWRQKEEPYQLRTVEGEAVSYGNGTIETETVHLWMEGYGRRKQITLDITEIGDKDIILGIPWLRKSNPRINWVTGQIQWEECLASEGKPETRTSRSARRAREKYHEKIMAFLKKNQPPSEPTSDESRLSTGEKRSDLTTLVDNIPTDYQTYTKLFSPELETGLPEHSPFDHEIPLKKGTQPKFHKIYGLNQIQMETLDKYLDENLKKGYIRPSTSPAGYPILFVPKKNGKLRLCVDYRQLNDITVKNCYPLPLIGELRDMLYQAQWFTTLDLKGAYNLIRIKKGEEWKTAFRTRRGHFEYLVMPFGLTNAPATFQTMINHVLRKCLDIFVVVYLDDILVFSKTLEEHKQHVHTVLQKLQDAKLLIEPEKCIFHSKKVDFLEYTIAPGEIRMEASKIQAIKEWPQPKNVKDVRAFLGFVNFYRRFIKGYGKIATPLTNLTKKDLEFKWDKTENQTFEQLRDTVATEPVLRIPDPEKLFEVETDASDYAVGGQLGQKDEKGRLHPCAFFSQKLHGPELNYQIHNKELMAIIRAFEEWKPQLSGTKHEVLVYTDHKNLTHFTTSKVLNKRQIKWSEFLLEFHFRIIYRKGTENGRADALSRRPDHEHTVPEETRTILTTDETGNLLPAHRSLIATNVTITPEEIRRIHENKAHGHQGVSKTWKRLKQHYDFQGIRQEVRKAIKNCELCAKSKSAKHKPYGLIQPLPAPSKAWQTVTMDFIVKLPPSEKPLTKIKYNSILVIVDKLTKYAYFLPYKESSNAEEIAYTFLRVIVSNHGLPESIVTDRDKLFTSRFWKSLMG